MLRFQSLASLANVVLVLSLPSLAACSGATSTSGGTPTAAPSLARTAANAPAPDPPQAAVAPKTSAFVERPTKRLTIAEARRYMLALVNRDRATQSLGPVELDEGPPTLAGQAHAEDMAHLGYLGHWGSDGSVPEQRHSEAGGVDMVLENALCFTDESTRELDPKPLIDPKEIERAESMFFDEVPPNDGHRKNILQRAHTRVGIGIAQSKETAKEIPVPCISQEFVDGYGSYVAIPPRAKLGSTVHVEATLSGGAQPTGIGVARVVLPRAIATSELNRRRSYPVPKPYQVYWGPGFVTPIVAKIDGPKIAIDVPLSDNAQPGLYEISVWAKLGAAEPQRMVGLRTVRVE